jgi:hypothetical protein
MISPAQQPSTGSPSRGGLSARDQQTLKAVEIGRHAHLAHPRPEALEHPAVRLEVTLQREHADQRGATVRRGRTPHRLARGDRRHSRARASR